MTATDAVLTALRDALATLPGLTGALAYYPPPNDVNEWPIAIVYDFGDGTEATQVSYGAGARTELHYPVVELVVGPLNNIASELSAATSWVEPVLRHLEANVSLGGAVSRCRVLTHRNARVAYGGGGSRDFVARQFRLEIKANTPITFGG